MVVMVRMLKSGFCRLSEGFWRLWWQEDCNKKDSSKNLSHWRIKEDCVTEVSCRTSRQSESFWRLWWGGSCRTSRLYTRWSDWVCRLEQHCDGKDAEKWRLFRGYFRDWDGRWLWG
jgi:hypothetical protein